MKLELNTRKSLNANAAAYYERSKKVRAKLAGVRTAIADTEQKIADLDMKIEENKAEALAKPAAPIRREKKWFEKFHHFTTSDGFLVIAGRDAKQNEFLVSRHLEAADLFMHAEIHGAPATVIKDGQRAPERSLLEAAQFSASYSSAWKNGLGSVDVYAVKPDQVSKHSHGEYVPKGGFMIKGERQWFKHTCLGLWLGVDKETHTPLIEPESKPVSFKTLLHPGGKKEKGALAKELARKLVCDVDELLQIMPTGNSSVV